MSGEVVYVKEEADSAGVLFPHDRGLAFTIRASEEQPGLGTGWPYDNPALLPTISGHGGRVFHQLEPEDVDEKPNRRIVFVYHDRYKLKKGHRCPFWL